MINRMMVVALCLAATTAAAAEIRKTVGPDGKVSVSNVPVKLAPAAVSDVLRPEVIGAVANVMGIAHLISTSRTFCVAASPTSYKRYSSAADEWLVRNAVVVAKKERILSVGDQRLVASALSTDVIRQTDEMMRPVKNAGTAEKIAWCDKAFADVSRGALDLKGRASIAPLMSYKKY